MVVEHLSDVVPDSRKGARRLKELYEYVRRIEMDGMLG